MNFWQRLTFVRAISSGYPHAGGQWRDSAKSRPLSQVATPPVDNQSGFALVMVMLTVLILEIICFFLAQSRGVQTVIAFNRTKKLKALYLAEAGLAHGLWRLQQDPNWRTQVADISLGDGFYTVSFTEDALHRRIRVNSQAIAQGMKSSAEKTVCWLTIQPQISGSFRGEDTYISEEHKDDTYELRETRKLMLDSETNKRYRILVRFNLGKYPLPSDAVIISGRFSLYLYKAFSNDLSKWPSTVSYRLHRITKYWLDYETTWNNRTNAYAWTISGGNFDSAYEDALTFTAFGWQTWRVTDLTRFWMMNPSQNYGLILETYARSGNYEFTFYSSANDIDSTLSPKLTVYYLDSRI